MLFSTSDELAQVFKRDWLKEEEENKAGSQPALVSVLFFYLSRAGGWGTKAC